MRAILIAALATAACASAAAQNPPSQYRGVVFLDAVAARGLSCGLLRPWQAAAIEAQSDDAALGWDEAYRAQRARDSAAQAEAMACDDEALNAWTNGAQRNFESELLAHFIVAYSALSEMNPPPALFAELSGIEDHAAARAAIAAKIAALDASGARAEGGLSWRDFTARTGAGVQDMARAYDAGETPAGASREQAEAWIRQSVRVAELWLADEGGD